MTTTQPQLIELTIPALPVCWCCGYLITDAPEVRHFTAAYLAKMRECDPEGEWEQMTPGVYYSHPQIADCLRGLAVRMVTE